MICVGIDVAKDKHDCVILNSEGKILAGVFTIPNNADGFDTLLQKIRSCTSSDDKIKVGLEATGHYSYNILGFLINQGLPTYVINPLHTNLYRKSMSLRKTKTDRVDAKTIATMLMSNVDLKSYTDTAYHNEELKSLTRYRFDKVRERAQLKQSVSRLVTILKTNYPVTPRQKRSRCRSNRGIIDSPTPLFTPFCRFRYRSRGQIRSHQYPRTSSTNDPFLKWFSYASRMMRIAMSTSPF